MLRTIRIILAAAFWLGITALLAVGTEVLCRWLGWMPKLQFLPAVLALNIAVIAALVLLTLLFGRVYCSVICPLGVFQDGVAHVGAAVRRHSVTGRAGKDVRRPYGWSPEKKWLRYGVLVLFVLALVFGVQVFVALLAPYSAWGRIVSAVTPGYPWTWQLLTVAGITLAAVVILAWRGGRTYCNTICPVGTTLGLLSRFAAFRPVIDADKCRNCHICENNCKASCIDIATHSIDHSRCVACFDCLKDCKFGALQYKFSWKKEIADQVGNDGGNKAAGEGPPPTTCATLGIIRGRGPFMGGAERSEAVFEGVPSAAASGRRAFLASLTLLLPAITLRAKKKTDGGLAEVLPKKAVKRSVPVTPPGSKSVRDFYSKCTACQLCIAHCPNKVLRPSTKLEHFMQPEMNFDTGWCKPECTACSDVCPTGAIETIRPEEKARRKSGVAIVYPDECIGCGRCARRCPNDAIRMVADEKTGDRLPVVDTTLCTGCGACEHFCPASPVKAIIIQSSRSPAACGAS